MKSLFMPCFYTRQLVIKIIASWTIIKKKTVKTIKKHTQISHFFIFYYLTVAGASKEDKKRLSEIRVELLNLGDNVQNLKVDISLLRHQTLPQAIRELRNLRQANAPLSQIIAARRRVQRIRLDIQDTAMLKHEDRVLMWCLRGCIGTFFSVFNRTVLDQCSNNC